MKIITVILFALSAILVYDIYFGHKGIEDYKALERQLQQEEAKANALKQRNQGIAEQINDFRRQGTIAIEELARSDLGLIKPNERFYRVIATDEEIRNTPLPYSK